MASARWIENGKAKLEAAELPPDLLLHIFSHQTPSGKILFFTYLLLSFDLRQSPSYTSKEWNVSVSFVALFCLAL
jgi:hypothetical protein